MAEYRDQLPDETSAFAERVAHSLRLPERLDPSFDSRLMERVRLEARSRHARGTALASWWKTERTVRFSPIGALALAAGVSFILALSAVAVESGLSGRSTASPPALPRTAAASHTDTLNVVRFVFADSKARSVELVGDFNEWTKGATRLRRSGAPGVWTVSVPLRSGRHEYAFIVNGTRWIADPLATRSSDEFGTESSVIHVGLSGQSAT